MDFCLIRRSVNRASSPTSYWCMFIVYQHNMSLTSLSSGSYAFSANEWHSLNALIARGRPNERNCHCALSLKSTVDRCEPNRAHVNDNYFIAIVAISFTLQNRVVHCIYLDAINRLLSFFPFQRRVRSGIILLFVNLRINYAFLWVVKIGR